MPWTNKENENTEKRLAYCDIISNFDVKGKLVKILIQRSFNVQGMQL